MVRSGTVSIEVGYRLDVGGIDLVDQVLERADFKTERPEISTHVEKVLKLGEVEDGTSLSIEDLDVVRSGTISVEIGLTLDVGNINLVDEVHE